LAYSTIENVGVIFASLGLGLGVPGQRHEACGGAWPLTAALFHVLNHSLFKSLLFFGAGAVLTGDGASATWTNWAALIHRMPFTSFAVLVGCVAISALPPFNGFVSEWLMFQAVLQKSGAAAMGAKDPGACGSGALFGLGRRAGRRRVFVKAFGGEPFLGRPRSPAAEAAPEVDRYFACGHVSFSPPFACWPVSCRDR